MEGFMGKGRSRKKGSKNRQIQKTWTGKTVNTGPNKEGYKTLYTSHASSMGRVIVSRDEDHPLPYIKHAVVTPRTKGIPPERKAVVESLHELWQGNFRQKICKFNFCIMLDHLSVIKLYFAGPQFLFVEEKGLLWRRSVVYASQSEARNRFKMNKICWLKWERIPEKGYGNSVVPLRET